MAYDIVPFTEYHLEDAALLVSRRYRAMHKVEPLLPAQYAQTDTLLPLIKHACAAGPAVVALQGNRLVGFLAGYMLPDFMNQPSAFSPELCNAAVVEDSPRIYTDMYSHLSVEWADGGYRCHLVSCLANDAPAIQGWHWLGFGFIAADGVRSLEPLPQTDPDVIIRRADFGDAGTIVALDQALCQHLAGSPIFFPHGADRDLAFYTSWVEDPHNAFWLAYQEEEPLAYIGVGPASQDSCMSIVDDGTSSVLGAYTIPQARGKGIAATLLNRSLEWARQQGYQRSHADFEAANPLAHRFWPRFYRLVSLTLMRRV
jgi:GNAT superfamily N-acetyltransferase